MKEGEEEAVEEGEEPAGEEGRLSGRRKRSARNVEELDGRRTTGLLYPLVFTSWYASSARVAAARKREEQVRRA